MSNIKLTNIAKRDLKRLVSDVYDALDNLAGGVSYDDFINFKLREYVGEFKKTGELEKWEAEEYNKTLTDLYIVKIADEMLDELEHIEKSKDKDI